MSRAATWLRRYGPAVVIAACVLAPLLAEARPGGGGSYGGGGGSSGGGGGGGGGGEAELLMWLIVLCFEHPMIGIPILIVVAFVYFKHARAKTQDWNSGGGFGFDPGPQTRAPTASLQDIRRVDPDFSTVLFDDFVYRLYASAHEARGFPDKLDALAPYLDPNVREGLMARRPSGVAISGVVIGAMRVQRVTIPVPTPASGVEPIVHPSTGEPEVEVQLEFEANVTAGAGPSAQGYYLWERWLLRRPVSVHTPEPAMARSLACPNCGAPFRSVDAQRCEYCGEVVTDGRFDWRVVSAIEMRAEPKPPALTGSVAEAGTSLPTVFDPKLHAAWTSLLQSDPNLGPGTIEARVALIYAGLNAAWMARDLKPVRGYLSDGMADYLRYWIEAYLREQLINVLEGMRITNLQLVKVVRDRWYDAVTFRVYGSGRDYTVRASDRGVVSGDPRRDRVYSEYWTLIRGAGIVGAPRLDGGCPNCGAPLQISMGGNCEHCSAHVTAGEFDWVLSKIEQDEVYGG